MKAQGLSEEAKAKAYAEAQQALFEMGVALNETNNKVGSLSSELEDLESLEEFEFEVAGVQSGLEAVSQASERLNKALRDIWIILEIKRQGEEDD